MRLESEFLRRPRDPPPPNPKLLVVRRARPPPSPGQDAQNEAPRSAELACRAYQKPVQSSASWVSGPKYTVRSATAGPLRHFLAPTRLRRGRRSWNCQEFLFGEENTSTSRFPRASQLACGTLNRYLLIPRRLIFESRVRVGSPRLAAAPVGPEIRP